MREMASAFIFSDLRGGLRNFHSSWRRCVCKPACKLSKRKKKNVCKPSRSKGKKKKTSLNRQLYLSLFRIFRLILLSLHCTRNLPQKSDLSAVPSPSSVRLVSALCNRTTRGFLTTGLIGPRAGASCGSTISGHQKAALCFRPNGTGRSNVERSVERITNAFCEQLDVLILQTFFTTRRS